MNEVLQFLGIAARSGNVVSGEDACVRSIREGKVRLMIQAADAGSNGAKKIRDKCAFYGVPLITCYMRQELGHAIGKPARTAVGITSLQLATTIQRMFLDHNGGDSI